MFFPSPSSEDWQHQILYVFFLLPLSEHRFSMFFSFSLKGKINQILACVFSFSLSICNTDSLEFFSLLPLVL